jgi:putative tryptophan/tyrosine transport system substrate-binding protein
MKRRHFISLIGGATISWPLAARAQRPAMPVVGYLRSAPPYAEEEAAFRQGLKETGFVDGQNITVDSRSADGRADRVPSLAMELVNRPAAVIAAVGGDVTALALKAATSTIPVVFLNGSDPVKSGLVASINRPGGNITGVSLFAGTVDAKRLELLHVLVPQVTAVAIFNNALVAETEARSQSLAEAAAKLGWQPVFFNIASEGEFDTAFDTMAKQKIGALFVSGGPFFVNHRDPLVLAAARRKVPAIYAWREIAAAGGLMSYGTDLMDAARQAGIYAGRILKGEKPADLPVLQPTKFLFVINLKSAKTLGLTIPPTLLALADEVIE